MATTVYYLPTSDISIEWTGVPGHPNYANIDKSVYSFDMSTYNYSAVGTIQQDTYGISQPSLDSRSVNISLNLSIRCIALDTGEDPYPSYWARATLGFYNDTWHWYDVSKYVGEWGWFGMNMSARIPLTKEEANTITRIGIQVQSSLQVWLYNLNLSYDLLAVDRSAAIF